MHDQLSLLVQLQALDLQRIQQREAQKRLPQKLKAAQDTLEQTQENLKKIKVDLETLHKERKEKEQALQQIEEKISKHKGRSTEIKTNKEYQAHLSELDAAVVEKDKIEDALLSVMDKVEIQKKEVAAYESIVRAEDEKFDKEKVAIKAAVAQLATSVEAIEKEQHLLGAKIDRNMLKEYHLLLSTRKGVAVAPLKGTICGGCNYSLPPQLVALIKMQETIQTCSYCHRILYLAA